LIVALAITAALLQATGYLLYARLFLRKIIRPNAASSFMFAYGTALLVLLEYSDGGSWPMLALPATCATLSIGIALLCLRKGATEPVDKVEATAFSADLWLTLLWAGIAFGYGDISPFSAGFLIAGNATTLTAFFPVLRSTWRTPERERPEPWLVWTTAYSLLTVVTMLVDRGRHPALLAYPLLSVALHGTIAMLSLRGRVGLSKWVDAARTIYIGRSAIHGQGMMAGRGFETGEVIWRMTGRAIFGAVTESGPNYIGLGPDVWVDPDRPLDRINHRCAPNAAFGPRRQLIALRRIEPHEEITIDYSTTEADPAWTMRCGCGAARCRKTLFAIQRSFAGLDEPPMASPLMQLVWRHRRVPAGASAFPQLPAPQREPRFEPEFFARRLPVLPASVQRRRMLRGRRSADSRPAWRASG
jgi:hypothetical protein